MISAKDFPFEYVGGGYFRKKGVPKGKKADVLHGHEVVQAVIDFALQAQEREEFQKSLASYDSSPIFSPRED